MSKSESQVQIAVRLATNLTGGMLLRNNSGVARELREGGQLRHVRYGLGNDSVALNKTFKSSDLIGITPVYIQEHHVGRIFGVFTGIEVKAGNWKYRGGTRETAQLKFITTVREQGGIADFVTNETEYYQAITRFIR